MHRPHFDYESENGALGENALERDELQDKYSEDFEEAAKGGVILEPAKNHPDWKWTILWEGYKTFSDYRRCSKYCDPDNFGMYISNDFHGYGLQELMENLVCKTCGRASTQVVLIVTSCLHLTQPSRKKMIMISNGCGQ
jgi:hypothetical protein